jgi:drug/metabolite transporter (DMT)-like permease
VETPPASLRTAVLTVLALLAFAANSVLARLALGPECIDPASYSSIRLVSGAVALGLLVRLSAGPGEGSARGSWSSASMLALYAVAFSIAYVSLDTGIGALILFAMVQITMILGAIHAGERPHPLQWLGLILAFAGLIYLVSPGLAAPSLADSLLMAIAGIAWGVYSLKGRGAVDPTLITASNFMRSVPFGLAVSLLMVHAVHLSPIGIVLAVVSGALTSGIGYAVWYAALPGLSATRAATVQLSVPVLAALGGVVLLSEPVSLRLLVSGLLILGGVALTVVAKERSSRKATTRRHG